MINTIKRLSRDILGYITLNTIDCYVDAKDNKCKENGNTNFQWSENNIQ